MTEDRGMIARIIEQGASELGINLPPGADSAFDTYHAFLEQRSENVNLTAIKGAEDVARLHFLDSLALLRVTDFKNARVIDIGSGAGFPGVPLKLAEPSIELTLLDASKKRVAFLTDLCAALYIDAECVHARAEEFAHGPDMREKFNIVASRAVARLNVLCELCLPYVSIGGKFLAMKGVDSAEELDEARYAIHSLGAEPGEICGYAIPETDIKRSIIVIRKTEITPNAYPRRYAKMKKSPITDERLPKIIGN